MTLLDLVASTPAQPFAFEILERTASTPRVQQIVQLSLAPAFLLGGIGAIMNVMMSRLIWVAERIERIQRRIEDEVAGSEVDELPWLGQRRRYSQWALVFSTASAVTISIVIALLFVSAYIEARIGTTIALAWVLTMTLLITGLGFFLLETRLAARGARRTGRRG
ncbi:DUF2721 domain-containing protein [Qipengyuania sp. MTN3-11]|uniref:DUF2721 domain-containing protein n=1 Tax=Qipengyuania sp. MTN3-11 TaxID=3056557 RepID=UPI0036F1FA0C